MEAKQISGPDRQAREMAIVMMDATRKAFPDLADTQESMTVIISAIIINLYVASCAAIGVNPSEERNILFDDLVLEAIKTSFKQAATSN